MDEGFTIKCNQCGKISIFTNRKLNKWKGIKISNKYIKIGIDWGCEEGELECKCGNKLNL